MFGLFEKTRAAASPAARLRAACFGKLPLHGDFIRHNLCCRETTSFEKWLQEGVGTITRLHPKGWPPAYRQFARHHFVLTGGEQENNLIGTLRSSQDKSGRIYPFALLWVAPAPLLHGHRATAPFVFDHCFAYGDHPAHLQRENVTLASLLGELDQKTFENPPLTQRELLESQIRGLGDLTMGHYWHGLRHPIGQENREQFWQTFYNVLKTVLQRGASRTHWGLRLPLPVQEQTASVVFWVQMVESILEDRFWRAHYFWSEGTDESEPCLTLFFRPLLPSYLLPLLNHELDDNAVFDLGREWSKLSYFPSRVDLRNLLGKDDASMLDVLYRTGRREMLG